MATSLPTTQTSADLLKNYVTTSFNDMAFPHLIKRFEGSDALINDIAIILFEKALKIASFKQKIENNKNLDLTTAKNEISTGRLMRILSTSFDDFKDKLPQGYHNFIHQLALNHLNLVITPKQNLDAILNKETDTYTLRKTFLQQDAIISLVCGAPGVGKSTYANILFNEGYSDISTDTYLDPIATKTQQVFKLPKSELPYRTAGIEGLLVREKFSKILEARYKNQQEKVPNVVIQSVKVTGKDLEGFFESDIPSLSIQLLFCRENSAIAHMNFRKSCGEHYSSEETIRGCLKDVSNQLFTNKYLMKHLQQEHLTLIDYLKEECLIKGKQTNIHITTTDNVTDPSQYLFKKIAGDKEFTIVGTIKVNKEGKAQLEIPENIEHLATFLNQSDHNIDQLVGAL